MKIFSKSQDINFKSPKELVNEYSRYLAGDSWWSENFFNSLNDSLEVLLRNTLVPGGTALDVGANRGRFLEIMKESLGLEGIAIGIEPNQILARGLEARGLDVLEVAISPKEHHGKVSFSVPKEGKGSDEIGSIADNYLEKYFGLSEDAYDSYLVNTLTLDQILKPFLTINFLKIDAEGLDTEILLSSKFLMNKVDAFVWEHNPKIDARTAKDLHKKLEDSNYRIFDCFMNELDLITCLDPWVSPINRYAFSATRYSEEKLLELKKTISFFWGGYTLP
jgi:FkbM family methyltransferase